MAGASADAIEVWGGIECTVNRVGERYQNQLALSGHDGRPGDLDAIAALGIRVLRYPLLWELVAPGRTLQTADWAWADGRLGRLRELGIEPIAGLVHHGSGPPHTGLLEDSFATGLAAYAGVVARRYPWLRRFTPVNEPLTTARFSGLYGLWYPHRRDESSMVRALLNQCRAVVLAMRAIRERIPEAQLVQTDDLGRVWSTPRLAYQAQFENERRWLTWDLLCGRVDRHHRLWGFLKGAGAGERELRWFRDHATPPDVIGINHYVTSDRYLDERLELFPASTHGGNGRHAYADVEAVRVLPAPAGGFVGPLQEAWQRYRRPLAITEVHLGCSREEQLRWLYQGWSAARSARAAGVDVRAITPWALLGSYDWNTLLTSFEGHYEPGAFDVRGAVPRPTAVAGLIAELAAGREPARARWLRKPGWWQRPMRLLDTLPAAPALRDRRADGRALAITGGTGTLGRAFGRLCELRGLPYRLLRREQMDIGDRASIDAALDELKPWGVINTAGYVRVDDAELDRERCERENTAGAAHLAAACAQRGLPLVTFSTDLVFDGGSAAPYVETDLVRPLSVYGLSKARAEAAVLRAHPEALVVRTSAFFGPWDEHNFVTGTLQSLLRGATVQVPDDVTISPTYVPDLVNACLDLLIDRASGLWHLTNQGSTSWLDLARLAADATGVPAARLQGTSHRRVGWRARRPVYSAMTSERGLLLPAVDHALQRYAIATRDRLQAAA